MAGLLTQPPLKQVIHSNEDGGFCGYVVTTPITPVVNDGFSASNLTSSLAGPDPFETFEYGFKLPIIGHWQSGTIDRPVKCEPMLDFSKLHLHIGVE